MVEAVGDGVFLFAAGGRILSTDVAAVTVTGYREEELQQMRIYDLFQGHDAVRYRTLLPGAEDAGK